MKTLCFDIGGTGIKAVLLGSNGTPVSERVRVDTVLPARPRTVLSQLSELASQLGHFDRISAGFPGVVENGITHSAPNLSNDWKEYPLADELGRLFRKPARIANDADVQGLAVARGPGVEVLVTLGTGVGSALFLDGRLVPNLELGHHPFRKGETYEQQLGKQALKDKGSSRWNARVRKMIPLLQNLFNCRVLYIGGGHARKIIGRLPSTVRIIDNENGLFGGIRLWTGGVRELEFARPRKVG